MAIQFKEIKREDLEELLIAGKREQLIRIEPTDGQSQDTLDYVFGNHIYYLPSNHLDSLLAKIAFGVNDERGVSESYVDRLLSTARENRDNVVGVQIPEFIKTLRCKEEQGRKFIYSVLYY